MRLDYSAFLKDDEPLIYFIPILLFKKEEESSENLRD